MSSFASIGAKSANRYSCAGVMKTSAAASLLTNSTEELNSKPADPFLSLAAFRIASVRECRGLPAVVAPVAQGYGRSSKVRRYYWRELYFATTRRFAEWVDAGGDPRSSEGNGKREEIERAVLDELKAAHASSPKYKFNEVPQSEVLLRYEVEVVALEAEYVKASAKGQVIRDGDSVCSPEVYAENWYTKQGYEVLHLESVPFHALFGIYMWLLVQDLGDELQKFVGFGNRTAFDAKKQAPPIHMFLLQDFGTEGYGIRRAAAIERHLTETLCQEADIHWLFDYWIEPSERLRQYLWAHRPKDVERARQLKEVLPYDVLIRVLRYLINEYWNRYLGWPDLLVHRPGEYFLAEVKSSGDKLSEDQKHWIESNHRELHLPFKLVKIHRRH